MAAQRRLPPDARKPAFTEGGLLVCRKFADMLYRTAIT
jgi:hypothetical protein